MSIENKVATTVNAKYLNYKKKSAFRKYMQLIIQCIWRLCEHTIIFSLCLKYESKTLNTKVQDVHGLVNSPLR